MKFLWLLASAAFACAQIQPPQLGVMLAPDRSARPVFGVTGSVTLGAPGATGILSLGCSKLFCLMKTDASIVSASGIAPAPEGPAWFSFNGDSALVYFPQVRQLARWHDNQLDPVDFDVAGEILAVRGAPEQITFAIRNHAGVWIVGPGNTVLQSLPDATGPVLLLDNGVLFASSDALILRRPNTSDLRFQTGPVVSLAWLGEHYVQAGAQARTRGSNYALRIDAGHERLFLLPEPAQ